MLLLMPVIKDNRGECYILSNKYITIKELTDFICDFEGRKKESR